MILNFLFSFDVTFWSKDYVMVLIFGVLADGFPLMGMCLGTEIIFLGQGDILVLNGVLLNFLQNLKC